MGGGDGRKLEEEERQEERVKKEGKRWKEGRWREKKKGREMRQLKREGGQNIEKQIVVDIKQSRGRETYWRGKGKKIMNRKEELWWRRAG